MLAVFLFFLFAAITSAQYADLGRPPVRPSTLRLPNSTEIESRKAAENSRLKPLANPTPTWLDTSSRSAVLNSYLNTLLPSSPVPVGWTGNITTGDAGSTSQAYRDAVLLRVNWVRQLAGVPTPITFTSFYNSEDQQAALMMSANQQLNHMPPTSWTFYTAAGADAASHSNLCLDLPYLNDPGCILQYMQDFGSNNADVGHRRWILYPQTQNMGTGDVQPAFPNPFANALWVLDIPHLYDVRPATRDVFVAWPPKGYIPYQLVPGRWSFSYPGADFSNATVTMQRSGGSVVVRQETPVQGYGENSIVWVPDNIDANISPQWPAPVIDTPITVTISNATVSGAATTFTYSVIVFDPNTQFMISGHVTLAGSPVSGATVNLVGLSSTTTDSTGTYRFGPLANGTYSITASAVGATISPSSLSVSATTTTADFAATACNYSGVGGASTAVSSAGTATYTYSLPAGCPWTATSNSPWLVIDPTTASGTGPISVRYTVTANHSAARTATITLSGSALTVP